MPFSQKDKLQIKSGKLHVYHTSLKNYLKTRLKKVWEMAQWIKHSLIKIEEQISDSQKQLDQS